MTNIFVISLMKKIMDVGAGKKRWYPSYCARAQEAELPGDIELQRRYENYNNETGTLRFRARDGLRVRS